jgi:hypothetical protein
MTSTNLRFLATSLACVLCVCRVDPASAQSQAPVSPPVVAAPPAGIAVATQPQTPYVACRDTAHNYFSAVFTSTKANNRVWALAFMQFLKEKYGYNGLAYCNDRWPTEAQGQTWLTGIVEKTRADRLVRGYPVEVIETGWKYE